MAIITENQQKLLNILNEIFQLDQADLDFGIYRIMNSKSEEIRNFLENDLISNVKDAFLKNENETEQKELNELIKTLTNAGMNPDDSPKVRELKEKLSSSTASSNLENDVFSHLTNFFRRYYKDGDFVSLRRYKKDTYAIPYEGEEVKLHWANSDQYYIKSGEYFRDYSFKAKIDTGFTENKEKTIHFKLSDAETEQNNNKATTDKERRFVILESNPCEIIDDELFINFEYKAIGKEKQDKLNEEAIKTALENIDNQEFLDILNILAPTEKNKKRTIFEKHLKSYTSRNSFDYFIHKDLGGFLNRELDFYIKNEILFLDDIMDKPVKYDEVMNKIKIFKEVAQKIIAFLTQIEELQKKLWEKKKFVIKTDYCITLDKIDEKYYPEILDNKEQLAEWKKLFDFDIKNPNNEENLFNQNRSKLEILKEEKYLVLDTKFFDMKFKYKLLSEFDNLDEEIDGVLINSENFGALSLLQSRYREQIKTVYIDPPYNTGNDGFLYNDSYKHSSWMSFMYDRLALGRELMSDDGVIFSSIDDGEQANLQNIKNIIFKGKNLLAEFIWKKRTGANDAKNFVSIDHEPILCYSKNEMTQLKGLEKDFANYKNKDNDPRGDWIKDNLTCNKTSKERPNLFYPITDPKTGITYQCNPNRVWAYEKSRMEKIIIEEKVLFPKESNGSPVYKRHKSEVRYKFQPISSMIGSYLNANSTKEVRHILGHQDFSYPKNSNLIQLLLNQSSLVNSTILDYFAGSGTTGHAVINLNREDNGSRKYILVEMGEYFDSVTKPRIQKVIYTDKWKDGKPTTKNGISQIFKYFKLESYEDTLNNIEFKRTEEQQQTLETFPHIKEDYLLNYSLDVESQKSLLDIDNFVSPFNYKLKIATSSVGETKETEIDLVETFNYLLGLVVKRIEILKDFLIVEGQNLKKEKILIIWRDGQSSEELNKFFEIMDWSVYDREFDTIYINGDNNLANLRKDEDHFKVKLIEEEFKKLMFGE